MEKMSGKIKKKKISVRGVYKRSRVKDVAGLFLGLERDFVLIFGGGFLVVALGVMLFFR
jgi:hypothetical protein